MTLLISLLLVTSDFWKGFSVCLLSSELGSFPSIVHGAHLSPRVLELSTLLGLRGILGSAVQLGCGTEDHAERRGPGGGKSPFKEQVPLGLPGLLGCSCGAGDPVKASVALTAVAVALLPRQGSQGHQVDFGAPFRGIH